ncbi:MAG TPA: nitrile hydratase subunit beta [Arenibaculum sp.]|nr:nitrile hydratase subunit beta [Arenibaculum sp.]
MNGPHDLGGLHGFGPVETEPEEPVFHADWERRAFALTLAMGFHGRWNIDEVRHARENRHPVDYLSSSYYEIWFKALESLVVEHRFATPEELAAGRAAAPGDVPAHGPADISAILARGSSARRADDAAPRFRVGEQVLVRDVNTPRHTRVPRYCRGRIGVVERDRGVFVFPDTNAHGLGERPQHCYTVRFAARSLWGDGASPRDCVHVDLWDDHLEAAP